MVCGGSDELFVNVNQLTGAPRAGVDQNRLFVGVGRHIGEKVRVEGGYQMQLINRRNPTPDRLNHVILVSLFATL
jgi:hypothetical protein